MLRGSLGVNTSVIFRRKGVDETSKAFHLLGDFPARAFCGPFEKQMLQKVRNSAKLLRFMAASHRNPDAHADTFHFRHLARGDPHSVFQTRCPVQHSTSKPS